MVGRVIRFPLPPDELNVELVAKLVNKLIPSTADQFVIADAQEKRKLAERLDLARLKSSQAAFR